VLGIALVLAVAGMAASRLVSVNYRMADYLPEDAQSTAAIEIMRDEFGGSLPNARVMVEGVTLQEALAYADRLAALEGISDVTWLDDAVGRDTLMTSPQEFLDVELLSHYYKDGSALFSVTIRSGLEKDTLARIRALIGDGNAAAGEAVDMATAQEMSSSEVSMAMVILIPVILVILLLTTSSWMEPLFFLVSIGVAVLVNMGLNAFGGEISFITRTVSPILQMAVSLDYAIFLLHSFNEYRKEHEPEAAMKAAIKRSVPAIAASAATTIFGFLALLFMRFTIGSDLGFSLVKGVVVSFISVMVFLPALTLACYRLIDKTKHRKWIPDSKGVGKWFLRVSVPLLTAAMLVSVPAYLAQARMQFTYGSGDIAASTRAGRDAASINERFGVENVLVLLVPRGDPGRETVLSDALAEIPHVTNVVSYAASVGNAIPTAYLDDDVLGRFYSEHYARILCYTDVEVEGDEAFTLVEETLERANRFYEGVYLAGQSATLYDMKNIVSVDTGIVNLCAVAGIFLILLVTYRSLSLPILLIFTIETAIWVNLSFSYFTDQSFSFIGYLILSTVQLGSTVDYAILLSDRYRVLRREFLPKQAVRKALDENFLALLTSAGILSAAGFALALTSSNAIVKELGTLLGRGTLLSLLMVTCALPALLVLSDRLIQKTTLKHGFLVPVKKPDT